jgi:hypothetical protein
VCLFERRLAIFPRVLIHPACLTCERCRNDSKASDPNFQSFHASGHACHSTHTHLFQLFETLFFPYLPCCMRRENNPPPFSTKHDPSPKVHVLKQKHCSRNAPIFPNQLEPELCVAMQAKLDAMQKTNQEAKKLKRLRQMPSVRASETRTILKKNFFKCCQRRNRHQGRLQDATSVCRRR